MRRGGASLDVTADMDRELSLEDVDDQERKRHRRSREKPVDSDVVKMRSLVLPWGV